MQGMRADEVPSLRTPRSDISQPKRCRKPPKERSFVARASTSMETVAEPLSKDVGVQAEKFVSDEEKCLIEKINKLESLLKEKDNQLSKQKLNIKDVLYYTGFRSFLAFEAFFNFLGPAVNSLNYSSEKETSSKSCRGRPRLLPPMEECFVTLVRLRAGLTEQDIAYRFSQLYQES